MGGQLSPTAHQLTQKENFGSSLAALATIRLTGKKGHAFGSYDLVVVQYQDAQDSYAYIIQYQVVLSFSHCFDAGMPPPPIAKGPGSHRSSP
jgi:hypothetical protein